MAVPLDAPRAYAVIPHGGLTSRRTAGLVTGVTQVVEPVSPDEPKGKARSRVASRAGRLRMPQGVRSGFTSRVSLDTIPEDTTAIPLSGAGISLPDTTVEPQPEDADSDVPGDHSPGAVMTEGSGVPVQPDGPTNAIAEEAQGGTRVPDCLH